MKYRKRKDFEDVNMFSTGELLNGMSAAEIKAWADSLGI